MTQQSRPNIGAHNFRHNSHTATVNVRNPKLLLQIIALLLDA